MKLTTLAATAAAVLALSAGAVLAAEACACCKDMAPGSTMDCCDEMKPEIPAPAPTPEPPPQTPPTDAPHAGHAPT